MKKNLKLEARSKKISDETARLVEKSYATAIQIDLILNRKGWNQKKLAEALGKSESEVSKWMTGFHNFTYQTIAKIESALGEPITVCPKDCPVQYILQFTQNQFTILESNEQTALFFGKSDFVVSLSSANDNVLTNCSHHMN